MLWIILGSLNALGDQAPRLEADQFRLIIEELYSDFDDISFIYEGETSTNGNAGRMFQGNYVFRRDGAVVLEVYDQPTAEAALRMYRKSVLLDSQLETIQHPLDRPAPSEPRRSLGMAGSMGGPRSPQSFFYHWLFLRLDDQYPLDFYEFLGWEDVDGHRCAVVRLDVIKGPEITHSKKFWIDLDRGGNPLRVEYYWDSTVICRIDGIHLESVLPADGEKALWIPVSGVVKGFEWEGRRDESNPPVVEKLSIVAGSIRLNTGIPDSFFTIKGSASDRGPFRITSVAPPDPVKGSGPRFRTDAEGTRERLEQMLADADEQSEMIEASSTSRQAWSWTLVSQILLTIVGVGTLVVVFLLRGRA